MNPVAGIAGIAGIGTASEPDGRRKYGFIDALRGYAVLMVITHHAARMFPELPYPLKKLTNFGWHGVQLFFLMSCVTLLMSWRSDEAKGCASALAFWTRRFFRIAPLYYLAAACYFLIETPASGFDLTQLLATLTFVNAWHPTLIPTTPGGWTVVPGGWSIGVEFTFYLLFPILAVAIRSMAAALAFVALALGVRSLANMLVGPGLVDAYGATASGNFLYFWFPNQLPVFALGTVLFHALRETGSAPGSRLASLLRGRATLVCAGCALACVLIAELPFGLPLIVPAFLAASAIFMVFALALANASASMFLNRPARAWGKLSFSAYLIHFAVLHKLCAFLPGVFNVHATGWDAILRCAALWASALPITFALSLATYRFVEEPMIAVGRRLLASPRPVRPATALS